jgi:hypothetical protein
LMEVRCKDDEDYDALLKFNNRPENTISGHFLTVKKSI